jgi:Phage integrase, N-terminal SAM-like domain
VSAELSKHNGGNGPALRRRFQTGNWRERNGVWSCKWREYVSQPDGNYKTEWRHKSFPGLSQRAAKAAVQPILDAVNAANKAAAQLVVPTASRTVNDVLSEWRKLVAPHHKPRGLETTESHLRAHIIPELGHVPLSQLDVRRVQEFVNKITPGRSGEAASEPGWWASSLSSRAFLGPSLLPTRPNPPQMCEKRRTLYTAALFARSNSTVLKGFL